MACADTTTRIGIPVSRPYSRLARAYDRTLGIPNFLRARRAFEFLVRYYGLRFRSAADVGAGTGLFASYLSQRWRVPVFAVDRSPEMLCQARKRCRGAAVRFLQQDLRDLCLPCPVELITANFDTINHLTTRADLRQALCRIHDNLCPGGHFIFDIITDCQPLGSRFIYVRRWRSRKSEMQQRIRWDPRRRRLTIQIVERWASGAPLSVEMHCERAYSPEELGHLLHRAGFVIRSVRDAVTLRPAYTCPPRLLLLAQKCN